MLVGNTHIVAGGAATISDVLSFLRDEGIETRLPAQAGGNPDLYVRVYRHFGIDEARELRERAFLKPVGDRRIFVIAAPDMTREAQNALLKTLEEPPAGALFFFILPSPETLLPTLRSRMQAPSLLSNSPASAEASAGRRELEYKSFIDAKQFLSASPQKRLDLLKSLLEKGEDDPEADATRRNGAGKRDIGRIINFLSALERELEKSPEGLNAVYRARKYVTDKGALAKPLIEQVALLVPRV